MEFGREASGLGFGDETLLGCRDWNLGKRA